MATIDIIILAMIGVGVIMGLIKGFVKQMASIVGLIAGLLMARALFGIVAERLAPVLGTSTTVAQVLAFILIWIAVPLGFAFVASLLTKALDAVHLGWLNRWLGSGLGALKYMILIGLAIHVIEYIDPNNEMISATKKKESVLYYSMRDLSGIFFPVFKNVTEQLIDMQEEPNKYVKELTQEKYKYGFTTEVHTDIIERGLNEDVIRLISAKKNEPEWLLEFRLKAYRYWLTMEMPAWAHLTIPEIDYQAISYYADPTKKKEGPKSMDEVDPELIKTFNKLGIPLEEQMALSGMAVDAVMDSVSVKTTFKETLLEKGIIFCSFSEAVREHPDLVKKYLGSVVGPRDNFFAALNSAVFSDGSFVYIPKGVRCPMELSTYFRINAANTGQFERTLIVADDDSYVSYLEGCTAPMRDENQLHAAIVEIVVHDRAEVKYSTVQNWYPGDAEGKGGVYNFVTKRGHCKGVDSKLSWTQVETGSAITWKYPSCILSGDNSTAEFYSVAVTNNYQQADTGTKMIHLGRNTRSTIVSKGISAGKSQNSYRGLVRVAQKADNARNYSQCDSLLLGSQCGAHTFPYMDIHNETAVVEHEATTSKISEDQLFYCNQRGIPTEDAIGLIVNGYAKEVLNKLPMEFAVEAQKLLAISLEGSVG